MQITSSSAPTTKKTIVRPVKPEVQAEVATEASTKDTVKLAGADLPIQKASFFQKVALGVCAVGGAAIVANVARQIADQPTVLGSVMAGGLALGAAVAAYQGTDLGSGFFHHAMDNYASKDTPGVGDIAALSQAHHFFGNTPEQTTIAAELDPIAKVVAPVLAGVALLDPHYFIAAGTLAAAGGVLLCQISHRWTHQAKPPAFVKGLQTMALVEGREDHHAHHRAPWTSNFCFVNGTWNSVLDKTNFWRKYEKAVYDVTGAEPKSWNHPAVRDLALGKIDQAEYERRFKEEIPVFKENLDFPAQREIARQYLHSRFPAPV